MKRSVWNVWNNKKKGSWKQATVGLMLFHCDYAETTIIIIINSQPRTIIRERANKLEYIYIYIYIYIYFRNEEWAFIIKIRYHGRSFFSIGCCLPLNLHIQRSFHIFQKEHSGILNNFCEENTIVPIKSKRLNCTIIYYNFLYLQGKNFLIDISENCFRSVSKTTAPNKDAIEMKQVKKWNIRNKVKASNSWRQSSIRILFLFPFSGYSFPIGTSSLKYAIFETYCPVIFGTRLLFCFPMFSKILQKTICLYFTFCADFMVTYFLNYVVDQSHF